MSKYNSKLASAFFMTQSKNACHLQNDGRITNRWFHELEERNLTRKGQISFLEQTGLIFEKKDTCRYLANKGLTNLKPYLCYFLKGNDEGVRFKEGTTWEVVCNLYDFDNQLRIFVSQSISMFNIAFKEQISYQMGNKYSPYWHNDANLFKDPRPRRLSDGRIVMIDVYNDIQQIINRYQKGDRHACTFRSCSQLFYFSHCSRIYSHLRNQADQDRIAWHFGVPFHTFCSWVHALVKVRNLCAHDAFLWNRVFDVVPDRLDFSTQNYWISNSEDIERDRIYYILCILNFLLQTVNPGFGLSKLLSDLIETYKHVLNLSEMGFPAHWEQEKMWNATLLKA